MAFDAFLLLVWVSCTGTKKRRDAAEKQRKMGEEEQFSKSKSDSTGRLCRFFLRSHKQQSERSGVVAKRKKRGHLSLFGVPRENARKAPAMRVALAHTGREVELALTASAT